MEFSVDAGFERMVMVKERVAKRLVDGPLFHVSVDAMLR